MVAVLPSSQCNLTLLNGVPYLLAGERGGKAVLPTTIFHSLLDLLYGGTLAASGRDR